MTKKKLLALFLTLALLLTQFSMLCMVSAETTALTGRPDFVKGVAIHRPDGYEAYQAPYNAVLDAKALGTNLIRTDSESDSFDVAFAGIAKSQGMNVMFVTSLDLTLSDKTELTQDEYNTVYNKFYNKATALKDYNVYIQIDNELDLNYYKGSGFLTDGTDASRYNNVVGVALAINAANKAVKDANAANGSNIKTIVNFSYNHYGFLTALKNVKIDATSLLTTASSNYVTADWDIIGWDYYSNMADNVNYSSVLSGLKSFDKKIIVCESNLTPESKNADGTINYAESVDWLEDFVNDCYDDTDVIGFVAYELYDQPALSSISWTEESHYGLIDKDGKQKETYNLFCSLYGGTGVVADRTTPAVDTTTENADIKILDGTINTVWPSTYYSASDVLLVDLSANPLDLSLASRFEFDIYIEDYTSFKAAVNGKRIDFALSCNDIKTETRIRFDIEDQITKSGWNHISLEPKDRWQVDSGFTYKQTKWAMIFFQDGGEGFNPLAGSNVAIANMTAFREEIDRLPEWPTYNHVKVDRNGVKNWWGSSANNSNFLMTNLGPINMEATEQVEFDVYIEDYDKFVAATNGKTWRFRFGDANDNRIDLNIRTNQITKSGWNHVTAGWLKDSVDPETDRHELRGSIELKAITWIKIYWADAISLEVETRIANICFSTKEIHRLPEWPEYEHTPILKSNEKNFWGSTANNGNFLTGKLGPVDMENTEQVEFDIFINTYSTYMKGLEGKDIFFRFGDKSDNYIDVKIDKSQITKSGWNHVTLVWLNEDKDPDTDRHSITGNIDLTAITWVKFWCNAGVEWSTTRRTRMANVCFTTKEINRIPEWPEYEHVEVLKDSGINYWGKDPNNGNFLKTQLGDNDITGTNQVEFDVYIKDYDSFKAAISNKNLYYRFGHGDHYVDLLLDKNQITKSGWNHMTAIWVDKDTDPNTDRVSATGNMNPKTITWVKMFWHWSDGSGSDTAMSVHTRMANVCFTLNVNEPEEEIEVPTEVMEYKIDFIGAKLETVNFDSEGLSDYYELNETIDISGDNMMLELDVFVKNAAVSVFTIELFDSDYNMAVYEFDGLTDGWNRLAIRSTDCTDVDGNATEIDFSDIVEFDFVGAAGKKVIVSNFYAANYVDGDANRDGVFNALDIVHSKKYVAGVESASGIVGNKVAMDPNGDSLVNAMDLSALRGYILNGK